MADFQQVYTAPATSPQFKYDVRYYETARSGGSVTYEVDIGAYMTSSASTFGYYLDATVTIGGVTSSFRMKESSPSWTGTTVHWFTTYITVNSGVSDAGGSLYARLQVTSNSASSGKIDTGGDETVNYSVWNTAPYWNGATLSVSPSGNIAENTSSLTISLSKAATDNEGNTLYYTYKRYINGNYNATIAENTTATSVSDYIGSGNQGTSYQYTVEVNDGALWSNDGALWSNSVTKNTLTGATLGSSGNIAYATSTLAFTISGASNTNGNASFGYSLSCSNVTVYNPTSTPTSVTIYKSGTLPTGTYVKFDDIKSATSGANYTGTFTFTLTTSNAYGSSANSSKAIAVDIRTTPSSFTVNAPTGTYTINSANYFIPDRKQISLTWGASTDGLGNAITYDIQASIGGGAYTNVVTGLTTNSASFYMTQRTGRPACLFKVIARTTYGYTTEAATATAITIDYYNPPTVTFNALIRAAEASATITGTVNINTSLPSIALSTFTYTTTGTPAISTATALDTALNVSFSEAFTGLTAASTFTFTVAVLDTAGAVIDSTNMKITASMLVPLFTPVLSVRKKGVGVNAFADDTYRFKVGGSARIDNNLNVGGTIAATGNISTSANITASGSVTAASIDVSGVIHGGGGSGIAFKIGDDCHLVDVNVANTFGVQGVQDPTVGQITFGSARNTAIINGTNNSLRIGTSSGWIEVGPQNADYAHIVTDRGKFYMNKDLTIQGRVYQGSSYNNPVWGSEDLALATGGFAQDISYTDLNNAKKTGFYRGYNLSNSPGWNTWWYVIVINHDNGYVLQKAWNYWGNDEWVRRCKDGTSWSGWYGSTFKGTAAWSWAGSVSGDGSEVLLWHNLGYVPIVMFEGTRGNVNPTWGANDGNSIKICNWNSGGNTWTGTLYCY